MVVISLLNQLTEAEGDEMEEERADGVMIIIVLANHPDVAHGMVTVVVENAMGDTGNAVL